MKQKIKSLLYIAFILVSSWVVLKAVAVYENPFSLSEHPLVVILIALILGIIITKEYMTYLAESRLSELREEKGVEEEDDFFKKIIKKLTKSKSLEQSDEIILDHNYDGIRELDNVLPPWWVYLFYVTITFAVIYLVRYEILGADNQDQEYAKSMEEAKVAIDKWKADHPNAFDFEKAELLTDAKSIAKGKEVFQANCIACHAPDGGGGIGPNLTDKYWILGGGFKNVMNTILNGGREGKGMVPWKATLKPEQIHQVASFVISLQGTKPANPKDPQGEKIWEKK